MISCFICQTEPNTDPGRKRRGFHNRMACECGRLDIETDSNGHWTMRWYGSITNTPDLTMTSDQMLLTGYVRHAGRFGVLRWITDPVEMAETALWVIELAWVEHLMTE